MLDLAKAIVEGADNPKEVVRYADADGYTALHRYDSSSLSK